MPMLRWLRRLFRKDSAVSPEDQMLAPPSVLDSWIDDFAVQKRPVFHATEIEIVMLTEAAAQQLRIPKECVPSIAQQEQISHIVEDWINLLRAYKKRG